MGALSGSFPYCGGFAQSGDFVRNWNRYFNLVRGLPVAGGSATIKGDSTAYGGPCRPMLPPLGLVEAMRTDDWSGGGMWLRAAPERPADKG